MLTRYHEEYREPIKLSEHAVKLYDAGMYEECLALLSERIVEAWFGFEPPQLVELVQKLVERIGPRSGEHGVRILSFMSSLSDSASPWEYSQTSRSFLNLPADLVSMLGQMVQFRQRGMTVEAFELASKLQEKNREFPFFYDAKGDLRLLLDVQSGLCAMLAGYFPQALRYFTSAQLRLPSSSLRFLVRDACAKAALVHALFGEALEAQVLLDRAEQIPLSGSWVEPSIDATVVIARAVLAIESDDQGVALLAKLPLEHVREMWPFYIVALQRTYERAGQRQELAKRLDLLEEIPFPRITGRGLTGSVFPLAFATLAIGDGNLKEAQEQLTAADQSYVGTKLFWLYYELLRGQTSKLIERSSQLRDEVAGLRQLNSTRIALTVRAHFASGETARAVALLNSVVKQPGGLSRMELSVFCNEARDYGRENIAGWPTDEVVFSAFLSDLPDTRSLLSAREVEVLRLLGLGYSRQKIAKQIFVSVNTVKSHLASAYRKLGVKNRRDALAEATVRGVL